MGWNWPFPTGATIGYEWAELERVNHTGGPHGLVTDNDTVAAVKVQEETPFKKIVFSETFSACFFSVFFFL